MKNRGSCCGDYFPLRLGLHQKVARWKKSLLLASNALILQPILGGVGACFPSNCFIKVGKVIESTAHGNRLDAHGGAPQQTGGPSNIGPLNIFFYTALELLLKESCQLAARNTHLRRQALDA